LILEEIVWESLRLFDVQMETENSLTAVQHRVLILGVGNILLRDEGIGVHVAQQLSKYDLPDNVEVIDGGTAGLDILLSQEGLYKLVVVDAVRAGKKSGTVYKTKYLAPRFVRGFPVGQSKISLHQFNLLDALAVAEKMGCLPEEVVIIGVEPGEVDLGLELTEKVARSVPEVIEKVLEEI
jgi:hydrogenase maturation protease